MASHCPSNSVACLCDYFTSCLPYEELNLYPPPSTSAECHPCWWCGDGVFCSPKVEPQWFYLLFSPLFNACLHPSAHKKCACLPLSAAPHRMPRLLVV
jgi:hypothetical protein